MLAQKKSLYRFLIVYISSTLFLLALGGYFYYKFSYNNIIENSILKMRDNINTFIELNREKHFLKTGEEPEYKNLKIAVYINKVYIVGNIKPKDVIFDRVFWFEKNRLFYKYQEHKKWGEIDFVTYTDIGDKICFLKKKMLLFYIFATLFIIVISFVLGKIFLKPMQKSIDFLEDFISDATHELNTPISNILANIEIVYEIHPELKNSEELKSITNSSFRISKIFKDLSFAKLNHTPQRDIVSLDIKDILEERINFFDTMVKNKNLKLKKNLSSSTVQMDREDLIRIIDNLLSNAVKYAPKASVIMIKLDKKCLKIENKGSLNNPQKVLQKYFREGKSDGGFGLGLYIVKKLSDFYKFDFEIKNIKDNISVTLCF